MLFTQRKSFANCKTKKKLNFTFSIFYMMEAMLKAIALLKLGEVVPLRN
jgi:hypothetical protein